MVLAITVGSGCHYIRDAITVKISGKGDGDPGKTGLAVILGAVAIGVIPDGVANGTGAGIAEILVQVDQGTGPAYGYLGSIVITPVRISGLGHAGR